MIGLCCLVLAYALPASAWAGDATCVAGAEQLRMQVSVAGLRNAKGEVAITLYADDRERFLAKGGKLLRQRVKAVLPLTSACFVLPAKGFYAVSVYHDANADHDFNRSFIGMPVEGFGFSRNPKTRLGLPSLDEVRVAADLGDNPVQIQLIYP